jgi:4-hydroxybenzoyl-CoA reductase subunit beta
MYLPKFMIERPESPEEAATLLKVREKSHLVAGGTELFPRMKYGLCAPEIIISLKNSSVSAPEITPEGMLVLDAKMSLTAVNTSPKTVENAPLLAMAAGRVATREIRNMGTLGGNLCQETRCLYFNQKHTFQFREPCFKRGGDECYFIPKGNKCWAVFMSDLAPALFCLDANVNIVGNDGVRQIEIHELYTHDPLNPISLKSDEIITEIIIPKNEGASGSGFSKFTLRGGMEFAGVNVGVLLETENDLRTCKAARITVGAVSEGPQRAEAAEAFLQGKGLTEDVITAASRKMAEDLKIVPHHGYSKGYLTECLKSQGKTALTDATNAITGAT